MTNCSDASRVAGVVRPVPVKVLVLEMCDEGTPSNPNHGDLYKVTGNVPTPCMPRLFIRPDWKDDTEGPTGVCHWPDTKVRAVITSGRKIVYFWTEGEAEAYSYGVARQKGEVA